MEILHFKELGDTGTPFYLVIDKFGHLASDTSFLHTILKQSDNYSWRYCIYINICDLDLTFKSHTSPKVLR